MAVATVKVVFEKVEAVPKIIRDAGQREYLPADILGTGGFASCWRTQMLDSKEDTEAPECALKAVKAQLPRNLTQRFRLELAIQSKVHHPNLVEFYRAFTVADTTFVALELCPNGSLTDMIKKRKFLTMGEIRRILIQLCGAVKYLHQRDVVHRDIKAGNIFLDADMNVKLGDFGLAAVMDQPSDPSMKSRRTTFCGTPNYLAPEILDKHGGGHGMSVDIWSIGILAYFLAVGRAPFHAKSKDDIYEKLRKGEYTWPELTPDSNEIPEDLRSLVSKLLVEESRRPIPDKVVRHPFFSQGFIPGRLDPLCKTRRPRWARVGTPEQNIKNYKKLCWESQVGGVVHTGQAAPVKPASMVSELAEELMAGRGLSIPLREGLVYRGKPKHLQEEIAHEIAESKSIASNSPAQSRVLAEKAVNLGSPRPKMQLKRQETEPDIFDIKAMRESVDELQDLRAGAITPPDPLGPIRADSPRVVKTQQTQSGQMGTPRKVAISRTMRESRASPRRAEVDMKAPAQPTMQRKAQQAPPELPNEVIDLTRSPPMFKNKSSLRIPKPKRIAPVDEILCDTPEQGAQPQQQQQQPQQEPIQQAGLTASRRLPSTLRMSRTVSDHSGRTTPSVQDEPVQPSQLPTTALYESRTLGRARRPATVSRTSSNTTSSPNAAVAAAAAAAAFKTSPQAMKVQQAQKQIVIPESPVRIVSASRPVPPRRATSRTVSTTKAESMAVPVAGSKITLEAAIEAAAANPVAINNTIRRAPRRARTAGADGVEGLLLEALAAGDARNPPLSSVSRESGHMGTIARRPRRAGVCYD